MLPAEVFAHAVAFLRLFDLSALAVTTATCSTLAVKASNSIRWEEFAGLLFSIVDDAILIAKYIGPKCVTGFGPFDVVAFLSFSNVTAMAEFISGALPNCIFEDVDIFSFPGDHLLDAMGRVADSVIVKGAFSHSLLDINRDVSFSLLSKFRKVKVRYLLNRDFTP